MGNNFRHNSHQAAIIILVILYFACVCLLILHNNHAYIVFTSVVVGWGKMWARNSFWLCIISNYLFIPIIIYYLI